VIERRPKFDRFCLNSVALGDDARKGEDVNSTEVVAQVTMRWKV